MSAICGPATEREVRHTAGEKWCFHCRKRREFVFVLYVPKGLSYYGPNPAVECTVCLIGDADLFPGVSRTWGEDE